MDVTPSTKLAKYFTSRILINKYFECNIYCINYVKTDD